MKLIHKNTAYSVSDFLKTQSDQSWILDIQEFLNNYLDSSKSITVSTSGSTGTPKPIELLKSSIRKSANITNDYFDLRNQKTAALSLPSKYIAGKLMLIRAMEANIDLRIEEPTSTPLIGLDKSIGFVAMTPFQLNNIMDRHPEVLGHVKTIILGGGPISHDLLMQIQDIAPRCYHTYGMTETITHIAIKPLNGQDKSSHFQVLDGFDISIDDRNCLVIKADHIHQGAVVTNDIVEIINPKSFKWIGRYDNVINTGGVKVYPEIIESKIQDLMKAPFFVIGADDDQLGQKVTICIESTLINQDELLKKIESRLDKFEIPRSFLFFDCFLYTETGKIKRQQTLESR